MAETQSTSVTSSVVVDTPVKRAFAVFTEQMGTWWPPDHHILQAELAEMVFEPRVGGDIYDRGSDGTECRWARVLAYEPPTRVVFTWNVSVKWQLETDPAKVSEVEVTFTPEGARRTRVELVHRHLERHGAGWEQMGAAVGSPGGWPRGLDAFRSRVEATELSTGSP
jgi:uncharacterized protein YndB with AHSA1/START domain